MVRPYRGSTIPRSLQPIKPYLICLLLHTELLHVASRESVGGTLNGIWSFLRPCLQESKFPLKRVKDSPPLQAKYFSRVGLFCYLRLNSGRSVSLNVNKAKKYFSRNIHGPLMFPIFPYGKHRETLFPMSVLIFKMQSILTLRCREFERKSEYASACKNFASTSTRALSNFCEQFERRPNFAGTFKLDGTGIQYS